MCLLCVIRFDHNAAYICNIWSKFKDLCLSDCNCSICLLKFNGRRAIGIL